MNIIVIFETQKITMSNTIKEETTSYGSKLSFRKMPFTLYIDQTFDQTIIELNAHHIITGQLSSVGNHIYTCLEGKCGIATTENSYIRSLEAGDTLKIEKDVEHVILNDNPERCILSMFHIGDLYTLPEYQTQQHPQENDSTEHW